MTEVATKAALAATKADLRATTADLEAAIELATLRLTIRLGGVLIAGFVADGASALRSSSVLIPWFVMPGLVPGIRVFYRPCS
jgi:hypothetical protein